ncbi:hypothetical protein RDI58_026836 [Solanum bulbocastanum]|uniref:NAC domain-containing protein n=1 Tax=Solanum bulbocastanum TaxID=147425 RepID=A0AAN8SUD7_SOLBU
MEKRFTPPSDCELAMRLVKFVTGKQNAGFIGLADVYDKVPCELIRENSMKTHYFFTELKKKKTREKEYSNRFNRVTKSGGIWIQQDTGKPILDEDEKLIIGYKRSLKFKHDDPSLNGKWMMKEYYLAESLLRQLKYKETKDFVISAIKKNPKSVIKGNTVSADAVEYKRFIDSVLQYETQEPGMENQENLG